MKYEVYNTFTGIVVCKCDICSFAVAITDAVNEKYGEHYAYREVI